MSFQNELDHDEHFEVQIPAGVVADALEASPEFVIAIARLVRNEELKRARATGNRYGKYAQRHEPAKSPLRRIF